MLCVVLPPIRRWCSHWAGGEAFFRALQLELVALLRTKPMLSAASRCWFPQHPADEAVLCTCHRAKRDGGKGAQLVCSLPFLLFLLISVPREKLWGGLIAMHWGWFCWGLMGSLGHSAGFSRLWCFFSWLFHDTPHLEIIWDGSNKVSWFPIT